MAYSINPYLPCARKQAVLLVVKERVAVATVARKFGVNRSTVYRWLKRWQEINAHRDNNWRIGLRGLNYYKFTIPTKSARPWTSPRALPPWMVERVLALRQQLKRCAEVIWHYLKLEGVRISLSSVRRILARHHEYDRPKHAKKLYRKNSKRPEIERPGDLVQIDTVHLVDPNAHTRKYVYTVIDLCSRLAYARVYPKLSQLAAQATVLAAREYFSGLCGVGIATTADAAMAKTTTTTVDAVTAFRFKMVQSDNGPEFGYLFKDRLAAAGITIRHSRPHRPNDNAHIERFNRTLRQECIGRYMSQAKSLDYIQIKLDNFLDYYNNERVHLSLQCKTPVGFCQEVLRRF
jgi:transposase InsO family protein